MANDERGRPALNIPLDAIVAAVKVHSTAMGAARALGCSDGYVRAKLKAAGLTIKQVLQGVAGGID